MTLKFSKNREEVNSVKWGRRKAFFGEEDCLPLWVADMDIDSPIAVQEALNTRIDHNSYGYSYEPDTYINGIRNWCNKRHGLSLTAKELNYIPGVIPGLHFAVRALTEEGDGVIIQPPVYAPFFDVIKLNNRKRIDNPLINKDGRYEIDFNHLEDCMKRAKAMILCSPHNPVGRVWSERELNKIGQLAQKHNVYLISDEIHWDIIYSDRKHISIQTLSAQIEQRSIVLSSPGKTFNLQGLQSAFAIIKEQKLRDGFALEARKSGVFMNNALSVEAIEAAYWKSEKWLDNELLPFLENNVAYLNDFISTELSNVRLVKPEGTYIAWLDFRESGLEGEELNNFILKKAKLGLNPGSMFGEEGNQYQRLNFACERPILEEALNRLKQAFA